MTDCIINSMDMSLSKLQDLVQTRNSGVVQSMGSLSVRHDRETEQQQILREGGQEEKGTTEDEMAGWHHCLDGHESE